MIRLAREHEGWALGFADEVWWSRFAQPNMHSWGWRPLRLVEQYRDKDDEEPKALSCYGVLLESDGRQQMLLRFVQGRPVSEVTTAFLSWVCQRLEAQRKHVWVLVWDNASWHKSREVRHWIGAHNREAKQRRGGVRILVCLLPVQSPWLNPIEPKWLHGKRAVVEPQRALRCEELIDRICTHYGCERLAPIEQKTP